MMYLLDTPVVSELRQAKTGQADPAVLTWAIGVATQNFYISALTLLELESGIAQIERKDQAQAALLRAWLDEQVTPAFDGRVLSIDAAVIKKRAQMPFADPRTTNSQTGRDALIAATALTHGLTLATRRAAAYKSMRVKTFNPWGFTPEAAYADDDSADWQQSTKAGPVWLKNLFLRF
jgi:predicted nucleic acid-binding protein